MSTKKQNKKELWKIKDFQCIKGLEALNYLKQYNKKKTWKTLKMRDKQSIQKVQLPKNMSSKEGKEKMD